MIMSKDKALHFVAGALASVVGAVSVLLAHGVIRELPLEYVLPMAAEAGIFVASAAAFGKEAYDAISNWLARRSGRPEEHAAEGGDAIATVLGGLPVPVALVLLTVLLKN